MENYSFKSSRGNTHKFRYSEAPLGSPGKKQPGIKNKESRNKGMLMVGKKIKITSHQQSSFVELETVLTIYIKLYLQEQKPWQGNTYFTGLGRPQGDRHSTCSYMMSKTMLAFKELLIQKGKRLSVRRSRVLQAREGRTSTHPWVRAAAQQAWM